jgi:ribose/xylose/arabinose/galactoside ABC-type transport system permease subunit
LPHYFIYFPSVFDCFKLDDHYHPGIDQCTCLAFGVTFVIITGGIDLSLGSIVAVAGVSAAMLAHPDSYPVLVPVFAGLFAGLLIGAFNGFIITKSKIAPFIVTLGTMTIGRGLALILSNGRPVSNLSDSFVFIGSGKIMGIPCPHPDFDLHVHTMFSHPQ